MRNVLVKENCLLLNIFLLVFKIRRKMWVQTVRKDMEKKMNVNWLKLSWCHLKFCFIN